MAAEGGMEDFSYSRDLLQRFAVIKTAPTEAAGGDFREVELSLGLSLGGCLGGPKEKALVRSSSVSVFPPESQAYGDAGEGAIGRTWSLPAPEKEEEWRRRKELQCLKRMEAKRKRSEKRAKEEMEETAAAKGRAPRWAGEGKPISQVSVCSSGSSSSGLLDFESKPLHGVDATALNGSVEVRSPSVALGHTNKKDLSSPMLSKPTNPPEEEAEPSKKRTKEMERSMMMEEMPCVSTKGDGPKGRRIEGFLYKYRIEGEEVSIVCVCHGRFLTPAEFVKHAGGGEVDHPLRHIVVNPNPSFLL